MKSKPDMFMLAPVAVSIIVLMILFSSAQASDNRADKQRGSLDCNPQSLPAGYPHQVGSLTLVGVKSSGLKTSGDCEKLCPYMAIHAGWVNQYNRFAWPDMLLSRQVFQRNKPDHYPHTKRTLRKLVAPIQRLGQATYVF